MTATEFEIRVFAMLPHEPQSSDWRWVHCLTFPVETLQELQFSQRVYKWIRYATGVVVGVQGDLSFTTNSPPNVIDYDTALNLPSDSVDLYISGTEMQRMFPADPDVDRTSVTSSLSPRTPGFRSELVERDGRCVLTDYPEDLCDGVHLLPHSQGDEYIKMFTEKRGRNPGDHVNDIDSPRNGILLNRIAHRALGLNVAFLITPNFAMNTADVDPATSPTERRRTAHLFIPDGRVYFGDRSILPGTPVRMFAQDWPPDILFDVVYANAVLRHFAAPTLRDVLGVWQTERGVQQERKSEQERARIALNKGKGVLDDCDFYDVLVMLPYILMPQGQQEAIWREAEEKRAKMERSKVEDKVVGWAKGVATARGLEP